MYFNLNLTEVGHAEALQLHVSVHLIKRVVIKKNLPGPEFPDLLEF